MAGSQVNCPIEHHATLNLDLTAPLLLIYPYYGVTVSETWDLMISNIFLQIETQLSSPRRSEAAQNNGGRRLPQVKPLHRHRIQGQTRSLRLPQKSPQVISDKVLTLLNILIPCS